MKTHKYIFEKSCRYNLTTKGFVVQQVFLFSPPVRQEREISDPTFFSFAVKCQAILSSKWQPYPTFLPGPAPLTVAGGQFSDLTNFSW